MRLNEIMNKEVHTIWGTETASDALAEMRSHRIHHLAVMEENRVIGVLSERDLRGQDTPGTSRMVRDLMTPEVISATPETTVRQAANLLRGHAIGCLLVMEGKHLRGIVTITDLLELLGRGTPRASLETRWKPIRRMARNPRVRPAHA